MLCANEKCTHYIAIDHTDVARAAKPRFTIQTHFSVVFFSSYSFGWDEKKKKRREKKIFGGD